VLLPLLKDRKIGRVVDRRSLKNLLGLLMRNFYINPNAFLSPCSYLSFNNRAGTHAPSYAMQ